MQSMKNPSQPIISLFNMILEKKMSPQMITDGTFHMDTKTDLFFLTILPYTWVQPIRETY